MCGKALPQRELRPRVAQPSWPIPSILRRPRSMSLYLFRGIGWLLSHCREPSVNWLGHTHFVDTTAG
jgi:hypothetical protein